MLLSLLMMVQGPRAKVRLARNEFWKPTGVFMHCCCCCYYYYYYYDMPGTENR